VLTAFIHILPPHRLREGFVPLSRGADETLCPAVLQVVQLLPLLPAGRDGGSSCTTEAWLLLSVSLWIALREPSRLALVMVDDKVE